MIIEPVMMNIGVVPPPPGYLDGLAELLHTHGALLTFDEVKTGLSIAPGGATERFGVVPDIVCLAKALGGGVPCGAIGGTAEVMDAITDGTYEQVGTFNGNPLTMAAAKATLLEVLTPAAYAPLRRPARGARGAGPPHPRPPPPARVRQRLRRQGRHRVLAGAASTTTATSAGTTPATATPTGSTSTTAGCSCRRGGRWSSGPSRSSTVPPRSNWRRRTSNGSSATCGRDGRYAGGVIVSTSE